MTNDQSNKIWPATAPVVVAAVLWLGVARSDVCVLWAFKTVSS